MFGVTFKNLPAEYVFAGYSIRKSLTKVSRVVEGKLIYDTFVYTYIDNYLSFYTLMENGLYKNVDAKIEVPEATGEDIISKHLGSGNVDTSDYDNLNKDNIVGVFGPRNIETLIKQVDEMKKKDNTQDISLEAILDVKKQYMGVEINGVINNFNSLLKYSKDIITIPAIKSGPEDNYHSIIGDELDFYDFLSNKDSDTIVKDLKILADSIDGVGNIKQGKEEIIKNILNNPQDQ